MDLSFAAQYLQSRPELRKEVLDCAEFQAWAGTFKTVEVDDELFYVMGGDQLCDQDELILEWARRKSLVSKDELT